MAKKNTPKPKAETGRSWFFPTLGVSVTAATYKEALALATRGEEEREEGDDSI